MGETGRTVGRASPEDFRFRGEVVGQAGQTQDEHQWRIVIGAAIQERERTPRGASWRENANVTSGGDPAVPGITNSLKGTGERKQVPVTASERRVVP